jgi:6-phosphogluconolactonase
VSAPEIKVLADAEAVASAAADLMVEHARNGAHIALSGGSTPKAAYGMAAHRLDHWDDATLWLGDERLVPEDDPNSNYRMAREQLGADAPIERVLTELGLTGAAGDYETRLRTALGPGRSGLDLALMGLGPDGHTASLFPGKPALEETSHLVTFVPEAGMEPQVPRVTLTFPLFNATREVVFLVAGTDKALALQRAFGDPPDATVPSARVRPAGRLLVLCDEAAAARLR